MSTKTQDTAVKPPAFKSTIEALLARIDQYKRLNPGIGDEAIGWRSVKDSSIVGRLRSGGDCTTRKLDAIIRYLAKSKQN